MDEANRRKLWEEYNSTKSHEIREQIIIEYSPLIKVVAGRLSMYLGYNVEYDDLVGYGVFGLIDAIDKFDLEKDVKFETYASLRIRGAILDQIRKMDWIPRTIRHRQKKIDAALQNLECKGGKMPSDAEIAAEIGITEDEYLEWQSQMAVTNIVSLNEFMDNDLDSPMKETPYTSIKGPEETVEKDELRRKLAESLEILTDNEKKVILLYYYEDLTLKEISNVLGVSESRISQLHVRSLNKMRSKLGKYMGLITEQI